MCVLDSCTLSSFFGPGICGNGSPFGGSVLRIKFVNVCKTSSKDPPTPACTSVSGVNWNLNCQALSLKSKEDPRVTLVNSSSFIKVKCLSLIDSYTALLSFLVFNS